MQNKSTKGFSTIELMIALAVIAILTAFALPAYQDSVRKSARSVAKSELLNVLSRQEQYFVNTKQYTTDLSNLGYVANGFYVNRKGDITAGSDSSSVYYIALASGASSSAFVLNATPQNAQTADSECATITLSSTGAESATGPSGAYCW